MTTTTKATLAALLAGGVLALRGEASHGEAYTDEEKNLFKEIASAVIPATDLDAPKAIKETDIDPQVTELVVAVFKESGSKGAADLARAVYRAYVRGVIVHNTDHPDKKISGFPRLRDPTSIQLLFRGACKDIGMSDKDVDSVFARYGSKKKTA